MTHEKLKQIISNWEQTNLIEGFEEKEPIALCLQSQLEFNETTQVQNDFFRKISLPLVIRAFSESKAFKNNYFTNYFESPRPEYMFLRAKVNEEVADEGAPEEVARLATEIAKEIDEAFADRKNAEIIFQGFGTLVDGTIFMAFN